MNAQEHVGASEWWLVHGEAAYKEFERDTAPRDASLLRRAEIAAKFATAHAALAASLAVEEEPSYAVKALNGALIPVSPAPPPAPHDGGRH
ncbi:hypothetical protein ACQPXB_36085 [Amycolatopsis sp. CA-161197]|uniref:hypothetical protein n=1 Tax=Amycolatopsis sp. CA-161197 TaxID=3239922 RepID=UPI003D94C431